MCMCVYVMYAYVCTYTLRIDMYMRMCVGREGERREEEEGSE